MKPRIWKTVRIPVILGAALGLARPAAADEAAFAETRADLAVAKYGVTGQGVTVAILDRGIDWTHPDFRNPDGTTRIKWLLDMTGQNLCSGGPAPVEYSEAQINAALSGGPTIPLRDAVGHGTVTAGIAAGNGRAAADGKYRGLAPEADLIIVKVTSEGAPAHGDQPAEPGFQGCIDQALDWLDAKITASGQPAVALINSGSQWGPMDGTSAVSRKIDEVFGLDRPGRVYVAASGDEGGFPTHARVSYSDTQDGVVRFQKGSTATAYLSMWYTGDKPATIAIAFDNGASATVPPNGVGNANGILAYQYAPGAAFYPWQSSGPDRAVWVRITGNSGAGSIRFHGAQTGEGVADVYTADIPAVVTFTDHLQPGRLTDYSTTESAIVVGAHVLRHSWVDVDGIARSDTATGTAGMFWSHSSGGPTRDGRAPGVDLTAPGHNIFAAYGPDSYWAAFRNNLAQDGGGWYGRGGATSGAAPIVVGTVALMLQRNPQLTARQVRDILRDTARSDAYTGAVPNNDWGYGKLDVLAALDAVPGGSLTRADTQRALRLAAGLDTPTAADMARLDLVRDGASSGRIELADAMAVARAANG